MGTCCCGNKPPGKFVGTWVDNGEVQLTIDQNGKIVYNKQVLFSFRRYFDEFMLGEFCIGTIIRFFVY